MMGLRVALAQIQSTKGDLELNFDKHLKWIKNAAKQGADLIVFPELSLSGYEPELAEKLAVPIDEPIFRDFQTIAEEVSITICVGLPLKTAEGLHISMAIIKPEEALSFYHKKYLHEDEEPFFKSRDGISKIVVNGYHIALAICYEISRSEHLENAIAGQPDLYIASVAKTKTGMDQAETLLSHYAQMHQIPFLLVNGIGPADNFVNDGRSFAYNQDGIQVGLLDGQSEGLLLFEMP